MKLNRAYQLHEVLNSGIELSNLKLSAQKENKIHMLYCLWNKFFSNATTCFWPVETVWKTRIGLNAEGFQLMLIIMVNTLQ